jgi:hypothetical protein
MFPTTGSTITAAIWSPRVGEERPQGALVVEAQGERRLRGPLGDTSGVGGAEGREAAARLHQQVIGVPVVAALELHQQIAAREAARRADRAHRRLGAARHAAQHLDRGVQLLDALGEADLELGRRAVRQASRRCVLHRADDVGVGVAQDHRPPRADVVEVCGAVGAEQARPLGSLDEDRVTADRAEGPHRTVHAAGDALQRTFEQRAARGVGHGQAF